MINPQHLIEYLRSQQSIVDAVGEVSVDDEGRRALPIVGEIDGVLAKSMPRSCILVTSAGGPAVDGRTNDLATGRQDVKCYGETVARAWRLHEVVYENLRYGGQRRLAGKHALMIRPTAGAIQMRERTTDWPYIWTEYTLTISEGRQEV